LDFEDFLDSELARVYIAGELKEAEHVESILTALGIDYAVDVQPYFKPACALFSLGVYAGAAFFVQSRHAALARRTLLAAGLKTGIEDDETDGE
jgi:hypothetical protein